MSGAIMSQPLRIFQMKKSVITLTMILIATSCTQKGTQQNVTGAETLPAFTSLPSVEVRDCIINAAKIASAIPDYDELDRDFLVAYASQLSREEFRRKVK